MMHYVEELQNRLFVISGKGTPEKTSQRLTRTYKTVWKVSFEIEIIASSGMSKPISSFSRFSNLSRSSRVAMSRFLNNLQPVESSESLQYWQIT